MNRDGRLVIVAVVAGFVGSMMGAGFAALAGPARAAASQDLTARSLTLSDGTRTRMKLEASTWGGIVSVMDKAGVMRIRLAVTDDVPYPKIELYGTDGKMRTRIADGGVFLNGADGKSAVDLDSAPSGRLALHSAGELRASLSDNLILQRSSNGVEERALLNRDGTSIMRQGKVASYIGIEPTGANATTKGRVGLYQLENGQQTVRKFIGPDTP